ncbi:MAG: YcbK family protein [Gemmatimonadaceae bacterium]
MLAAAAIAVGSAVAAVLIPTGADAASLSTVPAATVAAPGTVPVATGAADSVTIDGGALPADISEELYGLSGKLRARFVAPSRSLRIPAIARLFGDSALRSPGLHPVASAAPDRPFSVITLVPFEEKVRGRLGSYRMGFWPDERGAASAAAYDNPPGFIRVTRENQDTQVSEHFRLRDFLTKDQAAVWPKYLVLREELVDKLELVIADLESRGTTVRHVSVMSGFRTPQYNQRGVGAGGRAQNSRHQYGDAADFFVDNDRNGRLDDLNGDGRVDMRDVRVMLDAVERVERRHPSLLGGAGMYRATSAHGPFVHVDVRGNRARWGVS